MDRTGAVDVHYPDTGGARAALVVGGAPTFPSILREHVCWLDDVAAYEPGSFYKRELPAIRAVLAGVEPVELLVVDGYVDLDPAGRPGLGAHVHAELGLPVIGVAKTAFRTASHAAEVRRGGAAKPLYVTAAGLPLATAATYVLRMSGPYRLPDALRRVDALARGRG
ncbi:endonuclease V [Dactylosporangium sp. NPDC000555]|uniref:endonuclease V n=1 Tax=Dactylosporangium sp. NPDC000555 TaxID=3154260 RepID=UPI0033265A17